MPKVTPPPPADELPKPGVAESLTPDEIEAMLAEAKAVDEVFERRFQFPYWRSRW